MASTIAAVFVFAFLALGAECEMLGSSSTSPKVVCFLLTPMWMERSLNVPPVNGFSVEDLNDPGHCTHILFPSLLLGNQLFEMSPDDLKTNRVAQRRSVFFRKGHELKLQKPGLKLMLNIFVSTSEIGTPVKNQQFITHSVQFLKENKLDGLLLDCHQVGNSSPQLCVQFIAELCIEFGKHNLDLSATIAKKSRHPMDSTHIAAIERCLDSIFIETNLQPSSSSRTTEILNPVFNENATISWYEERGIPRSKMFIMLSLSTVTFRLRNRQLSNVGAPTRGPGLDGIPFWKGQIPVSQMLMRLNNTSEAWVVRRDASSNTPYAVSGNGFWATYEDFSSITEKARYIKNLGLGGIVIKTMELDDWRGELGHGSFPMIRAVHDALHSRL